MLQHARISKTLSQMKQARYKGLHTVQFHLHKVKEEAKLIYRIKIRKEVM